MEGVRMRWRATLLVMLGFVLVTTTSSAQPTVTITMRLAEAEWQVVRQLILPPFEAVCQCRVRALDVPPETLLQRLRAMQRAGRMEIDLFAQDNMRLQAIPRELYEAAQTDGAGPWHQFLRLTLPLLRPALTMALIVRGVDAFRIFALPLALAGRHLPVLSTYAYVEYLEYGNQHTAAASSAILLLMILMTIGAYLRLAGPGEVLR